MHQWSCYVERGDMPIIHPPFNDSTTTWDLACALHALNNAICVLQSFDSKILCKKEDYDVDSNPRSSCSLTPYPLAKYAIILQWAQHKHLCC